MKEGNLPQLLRQENGAPVTSREEWERERARIKELLCREEYGFLPPPPDCFSFRVAERTEDFCASKAALEKIELQIQVEGREFTFPVYAAVPAAEEKPMAFVHANFRSNVPDAYMPTEEIIDNGFAVFSFGYEDVTKDNGDFSDGLAGLFPQPQQKGGAAPGKISLWAWAMMRVMDYLQTREDIDLNNVAAVGHSRLGKTALLAAVLDERFAFAISNDSGCSGAAVTRGKQGERVADITGRFPYWFCGNYQKYRDREEEMPFDQHFLLSLMAPRKLYVCSAEEDQWADPAAELLGCRLASPVYGLYGERGLVCPEGTPPAAGVSYAEGSIGYHVRKGTHYLSRYDWQQFMAFLQKHRK